MPLPPDSGFAADDGSAPEPLRRALEIFERSPEDPRAHSEALLVLQDHRVLVPVVAVAGSVEHGQRSGEKTADMATVLMTGRDGRQALVAFTSTETMGVWDPEARPVPVTMATAAQAALADGAVALVIDVAGPVPFVVEVDDLRELGAGSRLVRVERRHGWVRPDQRRTDTDG